MDYIDLHTHSTASDGTFAPAEIFALAAELRLSAVALTDHDTVAGLEEFLAAAKDHPECEAVPGVELACMLYMREIHILGLFINCRSAVLTEFLEKCRIERAKRNRDIFLKLHFLGYDLDLSMPEFGGKELDAIGRPHFARALRAHYDGFTTSQMVFDKLLGHNRPAWVPRKLPSPAEAIAAIHAAGGVAVWAHPVSRDTTERAYLTRACRKLAAQGLDGIEAYYSLFSANETALVTETAARYGLALSGGSDFHGENSANVVLGFGAGGLRVPEQLLYGLKEKQLFRQTGN
ncbi:MAG: PHP domain-containing protein [Lentisphaeria bacterium]|nr:PHP domain-containing protein [Lentisphaeria bacterium]